MGKEKETMKKFSMFSATLLCLILIIACVTVNIYFPAGEVQKAADEIVDEVRPGQKEGEGTSLYQIRPRWFSRLAPLLAPGLAFAQVDINISTPAIRALRASLAERFGSLKGFYSRGALGENNQGYVELRDQSGLNLKEKADLRRLAKAENSDRKNLYTEIIKANNLEPRFLPEVQKIFANSWRKKALSGSWIQNDDGTWVKK
jgi:uncharacterized protein YdbL (DUF1318 family)